MQWEKLYVEKLQYAKGKIIITKTMSWRRRRRHNYAV